MDYYYLNKEHEKRFYKLIIEDNTGPCDKERQSLFYILAGNCDLYKKKEEFIILKTIVLYLPDKERNND